MAGNLYDEAVDQLAEDPPVSVFAPSTSTPRPVTAPTRGAFDPDDRLTDAMGRADQTPPDTAARIFNLQTRTGLPADVIGRNLEDVQKQADAADFDPVAFRKSSPLLASWLEQHPLNAALTNDDHIPLTGLEQTLRFAKQAARTTAAGLYKGLDLGAWSVLEAAGDVLGLPGLTAVGKRLNKEAAATAAGIKGEVVGGPTAQAVYSGFESIGSSAPILATGVLGAGAATTTAARKAIELFGLSLMGTQTGGAGYSQARASGKGVEPSLMFGASQGWLEAATEVIPFHRLLGDIAAKSGLVKTLMHQAFPEIAGEEIATATQDLNEWAVVNQGQPLSAYIESRPTAFVQTAIATIVATGVQTGVFHTLARASNGLAAGQAATDLGQAVTASKTTQRSPAKLEEFIAHVATDGPDTVYLPLESWNTYWQSQGVDPATKATEVIGNPEVYQQATTEGGDLLAVPTARYATQIAGTAHNAFFADELRLDPDEMNRREATAFLESVKAMPAPEAATPLVPPTPDPLIESVRAQLVAAGTRPADAAAMVEVLTAVNTLGERAGLSPASLLSPQELAVTRPDLQAPTAAAVAPGATAPAGGAVLEQRGAADLAKLSDLSTVSDAELEAARLEAFASIRGYTRDIGPGSTAVAEWTRVFRILERAARSRRLAAGTADRRQTPGTPPVGAVERRTPVIAALDAALIAARPRPGDVGDVPDNPVAQQLEAERAAASGTPGSSTQAAGQRKADEAWRQQVAAAYNSPGGARTVATDGTQHTIGTIAVAPGQLQFQITTLDPSGTAIGRVLVHSIADAARELRGETLVDTAGAAAHTAQENVDASGLEESRGAGMARIDTRGGVAASAPRSHAVTGQSGQRRVVTETAAERTAREHEHYATVLADLLDSARALDPPVAFDPEDLRAEFYFRVQAWHDLQADFADSGHDPRDLARVIAGYGGIAETSALGWKAEIADLTSGTRFGALAGVTGVFRAKTTKDTRGVPVKGLPLDLMLQRLQQDERVSWIESVNQLYDLLDEMVRHPPDAADIFPGTAELASDVGVWPSVPWWEDRWRPRADPMQEFAQSVVEYFQQPPPGDIVKSDEYSTDLFGNPTTGSVRADAGAGAPLGDLDAARALQRDEVAGDFPTRTQLVTHATRRLGASVVLTPQDAATATAYLTRGAQERFDGLVTDAAGKPLAVVGSFKGSVNATAIHPGIIVAEAFRIKDAAAIWFAHNHPSGDATLSPEDRLIAQQLAEAFRGTDIAMKGVLAIGSGLEGQHSYAFTDGDPVGTPSAETGVLGPAKAGLSVPVIERELTSTGKLAQPITSPEQAIATVPALAHDQFGFVIVDSKSTPIGFVPMDREAAETLREKGRLDALYRAVSMSASAAAFINATGASDTAAAMNLASALTSLHVNVLDIITKNQTGAAISLRSRGLVPGDIRREFQQERRGSITFGPGRQINIKLLEQADLSTFLHETGHLFLNLFGDVADRLMAVDPATLSESQRGVLADYAGLLQHFKVENRRELTPAHHEEFADTFLAYLRDGHAPSLTLQSAFRTFRSWLVGLGKALLGVKVNLTPDVRGILDRLMASDQAIAAAEAQRALAPMFVTAEAMGVSPEVFALYRQTGEEAHQAALEQLDAKLMTDAQREQTAAWRAQRQAIETTVTDELAQQPIYRALAAIREGTHPTGEPLMEGTEPTPWKLSRKLIVDRYGKLRLARLPTPLVYVSKGGLDPNVVAELFGFSSGDALLNAIEQTPSMRVAVAQETTRRMLAEHGSLLLDGTLFETARAAIGNEERDLVIRAELRALRRLQRTVAPFIRLEHQTGAEALKAEKAAHQADIREMTRTARGGAAEIRAGIPSVATLRQAAADRIAVMPLLKVRPDVFWAAARRAGVEARNRAARQDFPGASVAATQELLNLHLAREAERVLAEVRARTKFSQSLGHPRTRARIGLAGGSFLDQIEAMLDRFGFVSASPKTLARVGKLKDFLYHAEDAGLPTEDIPVELLGEMSRRHYTDMTVEEFMGVTDGIRALAHLAGLKLRLLASTDAREFVEVRDGLVESIRAKNTARKRRLEIRPADLPARGIGYAYASHLKLSTLLEELDGGEFGGPLWNAIMRPVNAASDAQEARNVKEGTAFNAIVAAHYPGREMALFNEKVEIPALQNSLSREACLMVALHAGNVEGRERLQNDPHRGWTEPQVAAILATLDERDWKFVSAIWAYLETFWPEIAAQEKRLSGLEPARVTPLVVQTRFGPVAGGYAPLVYDRRFSARAGRNDAAADAKLATSAAYLRLTTRHGFTHGRLQTVNLPPRLDLGVVFGHIDQVIHALTHRDMLIDTTRLLRDANVSQAILDTQGDQVYDQVVGAISDIATGGSPVARNVMDKAANFMRSGIQISGLGWNAWTALQQVLGIFNGMAEVGSGWVMRGAVRWLRDAATMQHTVAWVHGKSTMMKNHALTATVDLRELRQRFSQPGGWFDTLVRTVSQDHLTKQAIIDGYLYFIKVGQTVADIPTWLGGYERHMADPREGRTLEEHEARAIAMADQHVLSSQGGGHVKDLASIERGAPVAKLFLTFYSYGNTLLNSNVKNVNRTNFRSASSVGRFVVNLSLLNIVPAMLVFAMKVGLGKASGGDDEDWVATWLKGVGREALSTAMNGIVFVREMTGLLDDRTRQYAGPAGARGLETVYGVFRQVQQWEADDAFWKSLNQVGGIFLKYPAGQVQRTVDGWTALQEGRTNNPAVLLTGPPPKKAR